MDEVSPLVTLGEAIPEDGLPRAPTHSFGAGVCSCGHILLVQERGHWAFPKGRPEGAEDPPPHGLAG
eukprot:13521032-Alexandrium_andersonii.AAC.1